MISLVAASYCFGKSNQYIARVTGRDESYTFQRSWLGRKTGKRHDRTEADVDSTGLYEICDISRNGTKEQSYVVIIHIGEYLRKYSVSKEDAMKIGRALEAGLNFDHIVKPTEDFSSVYILTPKEAAKGKKEADESLSVKEAFDKCWSVLQALPMPIAKKVVVALGKHLKAKPEQKEMLALPPAVIIQEDNHEEKQ